MLIKGHLVGGVKPRGHIVGFGGVPVAPLVQRYYTETKAAGGQYYKLSNSLLMNYEFEIEAKVIATVSGSNQYIYDRSASDVGGRMYCYINTAGTVIAAADTSTVLVDGVPQSEDIRDGKQHTITVTGTSFSRNLGNFGAAYTDAIGITGIISDVKIWTNGDRNTGTLAHSWALDSDGSTSTEIDTVGGNHATRMQLTAADTELYTLNESTAPDQWESTESANVIPIAGTS